MEDKNELSDIILDKSDGKVLKAKRILIIIAILIIIFLIVLLSMKLLNKSEDNRTPNLILPPEPSANVQKLQKNEELFKQVPIIEENNNKKDNFKKIVKNLKEKESKKIDTAKVTTEEKVAVAKQNIEPVVKPISKPTVKHITKKVIKKPKIKTKKNTTKKVSDSATKGIYIQVGATSKYKPNKQFLKKIISNKFKYKLLPILVNGKKTTKILVGPFKDRATAKQNLSKVRKSLNKHAFIFTLK